MQLTGDRRDLMKMLINREFYDSKESFDVGKTIAGARK